MKFNLKNRPQLKDFPVNDGYIVPWNATQEWFEGFEKELRESLQYFETMWHPRKDTEKVKRETLIHEIKQILGE